MPLSLRQFAASILLAASVVLVTMPAVVAAAPHGAAIGRAVHSGWRDGAKAPLPTPSPTNGNAFSSDQDEIEVADTSFVDLSPAVVIDLAAAASYSAPPGEHFVSATLTLVSQRIQLQI